VVFSAALWDVKLFITEFAGEAWSSSGQAVQSNPELRDFFLRDSFWTMPVLGIYLADVALKLFAFGPRVYFGKSGNILAAVVTGLSVLLMFAELLVANSMDSDGQALGALLTNPRLIGAISCVPQIGHCVRGAQWLQVACLEAVSGARHITGMGKRRFVDAEHGFDLDLSYVLPRLIGMSVPAGSFLTAMYRNPLSEVVRFFETKYSNGYMIINCCPELPYPDARFKTGQVVKFGIQDHTPPFISQVVEFLNLASAWMQDPSHILAVHCRGGKGRTGSIC
ncbi:unnamed protein product, partial [Polarella glacialis]